MASLVPPVENPGRRSSTGGTGRPLWTPFGSQNGAQGEPALPLEPSKATFAGCFQPPLVPHFPLQVESVQTRTPSSLHVVHTVSPRHSFHSDNSDFCSQVQGNAADQCNPCGVIRPENIGIGLASEDLCLPGQTGGPYEGVVYSGSDDVIFVSQSGELMN